MRQKKILFQTIIIVWLVSVNIYSQQNNKYLKLVTPYGTEKVFEGDEIIISWESIDINKINIVLVDSKDEEIIIQKSVDAKNNKYNWILPLYLNGRVKICIQDLDNSSIFSERIIRIFPHVQNFVKETNQISVIDNVNVVSTKKIMPLGDSITRGEFYPVPNPEIFDGYRKLLKQLLENNGLSFDFVGSISDGSFVDKQHEGHGGMSAHNYANLSPWDMLSNVKSYILSKQPDYVLLHIGTNDINDFANIHNHNNINTTVTAVSNILDSIYSVNSNISVILAKIVNRTDNPNTAFDEFVLTSQYNAKLDSMANVRISNDDNLSVVNMESALEYPQDLSDGIHPNTNGYQKMSPIWFNGIKNILPKLKIKIFLQGTFAGNNLMNSYLASSNEIPHAQPFNMVPWNFVGTEFVNSLPSNIVDWVLVSLRLNTSEASTVAQRAGFLKTDGTVVDIDGISPLAFVVDEGLYYVVVEHRNHLPVMSSTKVNIVP